MGKLRGKGTVLKQTVSGTPTAIAQIISINLPDAEAETYESDTIDNTDAGIEYAPTGRTEGGSMGVEMFFDPNLAGHQHLLRILNAPVDYEDQAWSLVFSNTESTTWPFVGAGIGIGGTIVLNEGMKATMNIKLDKIPVYVLTPA